MGVGVGLTLRWVTVQALYPLDLTEMNSGFCFLDVPGLGIVAAVVAGGVVSGAATIQEKIYGL